MIINDKFRKLASDKMVMVDSTVMCENLRKVVTIAMRHYEESSPMLMRLEMSIDEARALAASILNLCEGK